MKIWFDTEFIDNGITIDLISIGMVREDGKVYYAECIECDLSEAGEWVQKNVIPYLECSKGHSDVNKSRSQIAVDIQRFAGHKPEFWAYYASYDWVALCQLYGSMMSLPVSWPMLVLDVKQLCISKGDPMLPQQRTKQHNALNDAHWTKQAWEYLMKPKT